MRISDWSSDVCSSDLMIALGAIRSLLHAGCSVPGDVSVVGYDDVQFARYNHPALTTIAQNTGKAGRLLVSKLLNSVPDEEMRSERVTTDLLVRESCGGRDGGVQTGRESLGERVRQG